MCLYLCNVLLLLMSSKIIITHKLRKLCGLYLVDEQTFITLICLTVTQTHPQNTGANKHHPTATTTRPIWPPIMSCKKSCVPLKSSLNQTQLIPLFSLIVLRKERVSPIRLLTPAEALSDLLGCRNEIMVCTITQLVIRDSAVFNERTNSVVEVSGGPIFRFEIRSPRLAASIGSSLYVDHKCELTTLVII